MRVRHSFKLPRLTGKIGMLLGLSLFNVAPAHAFDWASLWSTAEQRAAKQFENHQYDELINNAPDANWRGLGEYRKGDYAAAAKSFEQQRMQAEHAGRNTGLDKNVQQAAVERAMYNQANAHVLEENYPAAIDMFDELLESNPQHANAQHNRNIAQQLLEQQQQEQQQESGEQGEQSDENQSESGDKQDKEDGQGQQDQQDVNPDSRLMIILSRHQLNSRQKRMPLQPLQWSLKDRIKLMRSKMKMPVNPNRLRLQHR